MAGRKVTTFEIVRTHGSNTIANVEVQTMCSNGVTKELEPFSIGKQSELPHKVDEALKQADFACQQSQKVGEEPFKNIEQINITILGNNPTKKYFRANGQCKSGDVFRIPTGVASSRGENITMQSATDYVARRIDAVCAKKSKPRGMDI